MGCSTGFFSNLTGFQYKMSVWSGQSSPLSSGSWISEKIESNFTLSGENMNAPSNTGISEDELFGKSQIDDSIRRNSMASPNSSLVPRRMSSIDNMDGDVTNTPVPPPRKLQNVSSHQGQLLHHDAVHPSQHGSDSQHRTASEPLAGPNPSIDSHSVQTEVSLEEILRVAVLKPNKTRHNALPDHFDKSGWFRSPYLKLLGAKVLKTQEEAGLRIPVRVRARMENSAKTKIRRKSEQNSQVQNDVAMSEAPAFDGSPGCTRCTKCEDVIVRKKGSTCQSCRVEKAHSSSRARTKNATSQSDDPSQTFGLARTDASGGENMTGPGSERGKARTLLPTAPVARSLKSPSLSLCTVDNLAMEDELVPQSGTPEIESAATNHVGKKSMTMAMPELTSHDKLVAISTAHGRLQQSLSRFESEGSSGSHARSNSNIQTPECNVSNCNHRENNQTPLTTIPKFRQTQLDEDEIRQILDQLSALILQYISVACAKPWPSHVTTTFLDIPCIRDELLVDAHTPDGSLLRAMRKLLDVPNGVLVQIKIKSLQIEPEKSMWISGVLTFLVKEFVFTSSSPFEDTAVWTEGLAYLGHSPKAISAILQDNRIRTIASPPKCFSTRLAARQETFVRKLNATMMSLVGCNSETNTFHTAIAALACSLNMQFSAHTGTYEAIFPKTGELFEYGCHELDGSETDGRMRDMRELVGRPVLLTALFGVKAKMEGLEWRTCAPAKVRLWPVISAGKEVSSIDDDGGKDSSVLVKTPFFDIS